MKKVIISLLVLTSIYACQKQSQTIMPAEGVEGGPEYGVADISNTTKSQMTSKVNGFSFNLLSTLWEGDSELVVSPLSLAEAVAMTASGARGETFDQMVDALGLQGYDNNTLNAYFKYLSEHVRSTGNPVLKVANSLWYSNAFPAYKSYIENLSSNYSSDIFSFGKNVQIGKALNSWCSENTDGKINNIVDDNLSADLILANAVYFMALWSVPFPEKTTSEAFYKADGSSKPVDMMSVRSSGFKYSKTDNAEILELPYKGGEYAMDIILPAEGHSIESVLADGNLDAMICGLEYRHVNVKMPKFKIAFNSDDMASSFRALGMKDAFSPSADFSGISSVPMSIDKIIHNTIISVDHKGTEAAAATIIQMEGSLPQEEQYIDFVADRSFLFIIRQLPTNVVLFAGIKN